MAIDNKYQNTLLQDGTNLAEQIMNAQRGHTWAAHGSLKSRTMNTPPASPQNEDAYLLPGGAAGDWSGSAGKIAIWLDGWKYMDPKAGMRVYVEDEGTIIDFDIVAQSAAQDGFTQLSIVNESGVDRIYWDGSIGTFAAVQLTVPLAILMPPTNFRIGRTYHLQVQQDATGNRVLRYTAGAFYTPIQRIEPPLTTGALDYDVISYVMAGDGISVPVELSVTNDLKPASGA